MSTTLAPPPSREPDAAPARPKRVTRVLIGVSVLVITGFAFIALTLLAWSVNETHFDRPSAEFGELETQIASLPHVKSVEKERWVESPEFWTPASWMSVTVDATGLPELLDAACSSDYAEPVTWSIRVLTPSAAEVSLHSASFPAETGGCPAFGFDAVSLVHELDRVAPGIHVQPSVWDDGRFALVALEDRPQAGYTHLLPLVEHADDLMAAAGLDVDDRVEINAMNLGLVLDQSESAEYVNLLAQLAADHGVSNLWADGGTPTDGIEKVQIVAPASEYAAIERLIHSSRVHIADLPVRFVEQ
jgi:hypothetical protein